MPHCPSCRDEYTSAVTTCPDCQVPLVDAVDGPGEEPHLMPVQLKVEDAALRQEVGACLQEAQAPHRDTPDGFEIPLGLAQGILRGLSGLFELESVEDPPQVLITGRREVSAGPDDAVLERPHQELVQAGPAAVAELRALVRDGSADQRKRAAVRLGRLHQLEVVDLTAVLLEALAEGHRPEVFTCCSILRDSGTRGIAQRVAGQLRTLETGPLSLALHVLGQHPDPAVATSVLELLEHQSVEVRAEADEVLCLLSGTDVGFEADAPESERSEAVGRWREWVERV